jgi:hypothetical protein
MNIQNNVTNILNSFSGAYGTDRLADTWQFDGNTCITPYGTAELEIDFIKAKFLHFASIELTKSQNEKNAPKTIEAWQKGFLSIKHETQGNDKTIIASDDTMSADEYKERNIALIDKELDKIRNNINSLSESGYITKVEAEKALKKASKDVQSIFDERFGEIYLVKVEKEREFAEIKDMFESVGLNKLIFKKSESHLSVSGECSLLDLQAINARASVDSFTLKNHKMDISAGTVNCTFEKGIEA